MSKLLVPIVGMLTLSAACQAAADATKKPNVLLIVADDLQVDLGCYGSSAPTPNIDRLAARGVLFERAYCQQALCNPSRTSFLTGLRPDSTGIVGNGLHFRDLRPDVVTLPQAFLQAGYTTRDCGKIFHNWHTAVHGDRRSWSAPEFLHYATHGADHPQTDGEPPASRSMVTQRKYTDVPLTECRYVPDAAYFDGRVADEAVRVLDEIKSGPFFLAVGFWKPHAPMNAPAKYWDLFERSQFAGTNTARPAGAPEIAFHDGRELRGVPPDQTTFSPDQTAELRHGYRANIAYMDTQVGKVLDALDRSGAAESTIVVFLADHGYHLGEHGLFGKTSCFELDARVPLIVAAPQMPKRGVRAAAPVELLDLFPTFADLCGVPTPTNLEGQSLRPLLADPTASVKPAAFTEHPRPAYFDRTPSGVPAAMGYSVRTTRVRYTEWREWETGRIAARELYEHATDPTEMRNAVDAPTDAAALSEAVAALHAQFPTDVAPAARLKKK
jgi:iduronate 2-sulfatase